MIIVNVQEHKWKRYPILSLRSNNDRKLACYYSGFEMLPLAPPLWMPMDMVLPKDGPDFPACLGVSQNM